MIKMRFLLFLALTASVSILHAQPTSSLVATDLSKLNTPEQELSPLVSADGSALYFTREVWAKTKEDAKEASNILLRSARMADGTWGTPEILPGFANVTVFGAITMDSAGEMFISYHPAGDKNHTLLIGRIEGNAILPLDALGEKGWNAHPSISGDGKELYFASNRLGPATEIKLFVSRRRDDKSWAEPVVLESKFNTSKFNGFPSISRDGKVLFFSSLKGGRGLEIWAASRTNVSDSWSRPVLLPSPINAVNNSLFAFLSPTQKEFYFCSDREGGKTKMDIYEVKLPNGVADLLGTH